MCKWVLRPICRCKTRLKIRKDTVFKNFSLNCPKCKQETIINVRNMKVTLAEHKQNFLCMPKKRTAFTDKKRGMETKNSIPLLKCLINRRDLFRQS